MIEWDTDPITIAKSLAELCEASRGEFVGVKGRDYRDWIVEELELPLSGRQLGRYLRLLKTPKEVQDACQRGDLAMDDVLKLAGLSHEEQERIADAIYFNDCPREALKFHLDTTVERYRQLLLLTRKFLDQLDAGAENIAGTANDLMPIEVLEGLGKFVEKMKPLERKARKEADRRMEDKLSELSSLAGLMSGGSKVPNY